MVSQRDSDIDAERARRATLGFGGKIGETLRVAASYPVAAIVALIEAMRRR